MDFETPDKHGTAPDLALVGKQFRHSGNLHVYTVGGFTFHGDTDEWAVWFMREGCDVPFSRTLLNFRGDRGSEPRFYEILG